MKKLPKFEKWLSAQFAKAYDLPTGQAREKVRELQAIRSKIYNPK